MDFFFGGWEPGKEVSKKFDNYKEWLDQSLKAYTYSYSIGSVTSFDWFLLR